MNTRHDAHLAFAPVILDLHDTRFNLNQHLDRLLTQPPCDAILCGWMDNSAAINVLYDGFLNRPQPRPVMLVALDSLAKRPIDPTIMATFKRRLAFIADLLILNIEDARLMAGFHPDDSLNPEDMLNVLITIGVNAVLLCHEDGFHSHYDDDIRVYPARPFLSCYHLARDMAGFIPPNHDINEMMTDFFGHPVS